MSITPVFAWYDFWIGVFWDRSKRRLYILPLPCIGVLIQFKPKTTRRHVLRTACAHTWRRYPSFGRWRCMECGAEGDLPFVEPKP